MISYVLAAFIELLMDYVYYHYIDTNPWYIVFLRSSSLFLTSFLAFYYEKKNLPSWTLKSFYQAVITILAIILSMKGLKSGGLFQSYLILYLTPLIQTQFLNTYLLLFLFFLSNFNPLFLSSYLFGMIDREISKSSVKEFVFKTNGMIALILFPFLPIFYCKMTLCITIYIILCNIYTYNLFYSYTTMTRFQTLLLRTLHISLIILMKYLKCI